MKKLVAVKFIAMITLAMAASSQAQEGSSAAGLLGDAEAGADKIQVCVACHGESGNDSSLPNVPKIGGQNAKYLLKQLIEIKADVRVVPEMSGMLTDLNEEDLADVSVYYASQEDPLGAAEPQLVELGEEIYRAGIPEIGVAACTGCHAPTGNGNEPAGYPMLGGQLAAYTEKQLQDFRSGFRANDESGVMRAVTDRLSDEEINALASYVSGLRP